MVTTKEEFIHSFLPDSVRDIHFIQIDLDIVNLSIPDILRNVNRSYPKNSRDRNRISSNEKVVAIMCKSKLIRPYHGVLLLICGDSTIIDIVSRNYVVIGISEEKISNEEILNLTVEKIGLFMAKLYREIEQFEQYQNFYVRYLYNDAEMEEDYPIEEF